MLKKNIFIILIFVSVIFISSCEQQIIDLNLDSIAKSCSKYAGDNPYGFQYNGANEIAHGKGEDCYTLYNNLPNKNMPKLCNYFQHERQKAICVGLSISEIGDKSCEEFGEYKDICKLNFVDKLLYTSDISEDKINDICLNINNKTFSSMCLDFIRYKNGELNGNYFVMNYGGEISYGWGYHSLPGLYSQDT